MSELPKIAKTSNIVSDLKAFGYAIAKDIVPVEECLSMAEMLDDLEKKHQEGKISSAQELILDGGQAIMRNVHIALPDIFLPLLDLPPIWDVVCSVLNDTPILDGCSASRSGAKDGSPHVDGHLPISDFEQTTDIVAITCLDDFTESNGGTCVCPLSHKSGIRVQNASDSDSLGISYDRKRDLFGGVNAVAPRGSVIYILGQTWHQITRNYDESRRWAILAHYKRWWIKPSTDYTHCGSKLYRQLTPRQKFLFGFNSRPPVNFEKRVKTLMSVDNLPENYADVLKF